MLKKKKTEEVAEVASINPLTTDLQRSDLNELRDKVNEIIASLA